MDKICFMFGHREVGTEILPKLEAAIERHYLTHNVNVFVIGRYGGFDRMASAAAIMAKKKHCGIRLLSLTPYHPSECPVQVPEGFDGMIYPDGMETVPRRYAISEANRRMIKTAQTIICWVRWNGNSGDMLAFAERRAAGGSLLIENIARCRSEQ